MPRTSPKIRRLTWGSVEVEGHGAFKDVKTWPGGARAWDWTETGTAHEPGIQVADVRELVDEGADVVVLSRGMQERLKVPEATVAWLEDQGLEVHVLQTERAVAYYNKLAEQADVGALVHSTC
ncbi:MAG: Mth938-like domain-containing protein [Candidatus Thermoplasmatota archaeon]|nr:Mth938-like domain-containing protein [Candidatus Thermoplasmatota archaeon]